MRNSKGFSLAGVLVAMVIIGVIAIAGFQIHVIVGRAIFNQHRRHTAVNLAHSQIEDLRELAKTTEHFDNSTIFKTALNPHLPTPRLFRMPDLNGDGTPEFRMAYTLTDRKFPNSTSTSAADYKIITVNCDYDLSGGGTRAFNLRGFIVR